VQAAPQRYPVTVEVEDFAGQHDRLTAAFRIVLAVPHLIMVGAPGLLGSAALTALTLAFDPGTGDDFNSLSNNTSAVTSAAVIGAIILWFALIFGRRAPAGLRQFSLFFLSWQLRAYSYISLLRDEYPPLGPGEYPTHLTVAEPSIDERRQASIFFRIILAIPHFIVLFFVNLVWTLLLIFAWFAILFTGRHPQSLREFSVGAIRWNLRFAAYMLLLVDDYPPFGFAR
jgi:hypothetical protein